MERTFHQRFTMGAKCGISLFTLLAFYLFWMKTAILAIFVVIIIVGMMERVSHTTYTFRRVKPIDRDGEYEFLIVNKGRFSSSLNIPLHEIFRVRKMATALGFDHYLLIEYGAGNTISVQPQDEESFLSELKTRKDLEV